MMVDGDPLNINARGYAQLGKLLDFLETEEAIDFKARLQAMTVILRCQVMYVALRKEQKGKPNAGSAVRKYSGAFKTTNAARGRKGNTRAKPAAKPEPDDQFSIERLLAEDDENAA
jgi:hypothetical protein